VKYCIFGGSFDPPHEGHRHLARTAFTSLQLDRVFWVPAQDPPHKTRPGTPFHQRVAMTRLAIAAMSGHSVSDLENHLPSPSYSLNTILAMKAEYGAEHAWHFLIGADNWAIFPSWHRPQDVLKEVTLVVYPRKGDLLGTLPDGVMRLDVPEIPGESRGIRAAIAATGNLEKAGVLPEIRGYIREQGLYGFGKGSGPGTGKADAN